MSGDKYQRMADESHDDYVTDKLKAELDEAVELLKKTVDTDNNLSECVLVIHAVRKFLDKVGKE